MDERSAEDSQRKVGAAPAPAIAGAEGSNLLAVVVLRFVDAAKLAVHQELVAATVHSAGAAKSDLVGGRVLLLGVVHLKLEAGIVVEVGKVMLVEEDEVDDQQSLCGEGCSFAHTSAFASPNLVDFVWYGLFASPCCNRSTVYRRQPARGRLG